MNVLERIKNGETEVMLLDITEFNGITGKVQSEEEDKEELIRLAEKCQSIQWISVNDMLPEIGDVVNVVITNNEDKIISTSAVRLIAYEGCLTYHWKGGTYWQMMLPERVTHWMPIPDQPNRED